MPNGASYSEAQRGHIAGLLLAAGEGSRLGLSKALVTVGGVRLADRGVQLLRDGGCDSITAVVGAAMVEIPGAVTVENPYWRSGMGSSLRAGLAALPDEASAVVVALVDQPYIGPPVVRRLIESYASGSEIAVACYDAKPRNPVLFDRRHWGAIAEVAVGDVGARPFLRAHADMLNCVECADIADPADIDTPEDLARVMKR